MNSFNREERLMRLMGGTPESQPQPKVSPLAGLLVFILRVALATVVVALIDVGLDNDYDLSLWGMIRVGFGGLLAVACLPQRLRKLLPSDWVTDAYCYRYHGAQAPPVRTSLLML